MAIVPIKKCPDIGTGTENRLQNILCKFQRQSMGPESKTFPANTFPSKVQWHPRLYYLRQKSPTKTCLSSHLQHTFAVSERHSQLWCQQCNKNKAVACQLFEAISTLKHQRCGCWQHIPLQPHNLSPLRPRYTNELHGQHRSSQYLRIQYSEYFSNHLGRHFKSSIVGLGLRTSLHWYIDDKGTQYLNLFSSSLNHLFTYATL